MSSQHLNSTRQNHYSQWFGDPFASIQLDVGSGYGELICRLGRRFPTTYFIGVEIIENKCHTTKRKIERLGLKNVAVVNMEAHTFIANHIPDSRLKAVHIYFPSPYPNRDLGLAHRLVTIPFLNQVHRTLKPEGSLRIITDHKGYFTQILRNLGEQGWWPVEWIPPIDTRSNDYLVETQWERKLRPSSKIFSFQVLK